jgi:hypothetical protein
VLTKSFHSCNPHARPTVLGSSHASAVAPRVSLQARSCHKEDSTRGFIAPSLKPRAEFFRLGTLPKVPSNLKPY